MTQIELRCWAIEQAVASGAQDVLEKAREILAFADAVPPIDAPDPTSRRHHASVWTPERVALLVRMRHEGARTPVIHKAMNDLPGHRLTFTAVVARISQMKLPNAGTDKQIAAVTAMAAAKRAA